uniref:RNA-binding protein 45-like isoform X2 n=1 Tax=Myxine glutinosa TaxID=7769 RepID=UPI00358FBAC7
MASPSERESESDKDRDREMHSGYRGYVNLDEPPNSRLFLVVSRSTTETELRAMFDKFGEIQDVWSVKDKFTKEAKGVAYVKFGKSSQACRAMEELNGKSLSDGKPMKVLIAQSRSSSCHRDVEDEDLTRIFVMIPKTFTQEDLKSNFEEFGDIEYCRIQRDKATGEGKGYGYVRYMRPSQAALAIEDSDRRFRAILAEPKYRTNQGPQSEWHHPAQGSRDNFGHDGRFQGGAMQNVQNLGPKPMPAPFGEFDRRHAAPPSSNQLSNHLPGFTRCLSVAMNASITREQLTSIFRLIPGLDFCDAQKDIFNGCRLGYIRYNNPASAIYAKEKLHKFEYPPGSPLNVNFVEDVDLASSGENALGMMALQLVTAQVMSVVSSSFNNSSPSQGQMPPRMMLNSPAAAPPQPPPFYDAPYENSFTSASLPPRQPLVPPDSPMKKRLFIVCSNIPPPIDALHDVFCRFGNLIEIYMLANKCYGFAKYADESSAKAAIQVMNGEEVCGVKLKVLPADPPKDDPRKRQRTF